MKSYVLGRYLSEPAVLAAARQLRQRGHRGLDLHSPVPIHGAAEALGLRRSRIPLVALLGGLSGAASGFLFQWWTVGVNYPLNVGNRPPVSAPAFIPITFELAVLFAAVGIVFSLLVLAGFPRTHHPVFEVESFRSASIDGLWLSAEVAPEEAVALAREVKALGADLVYLIPEGAEAIPQ